ncbi:MAG TPA: ATP-binding cassette domain-containing protein [Bacteroidaceae bacterium]|nr:ATP-binding cassette domain-containing protein [Bacteroidaceae bacterium]
MIEIKQLYKSFGDVVAVNNISTKYESGIVNMVIGRSGSGKTVLLNCVAGLITPDKGDILYNGRSYRSMQVRLKNILRREVGMLFQNSALFDSKTVIENVRFPLDMFSDMSESERTKRAQFCLNRVGLNNVDKKLPGELSGGMQKRAAIARAIALNPKYLFCDEPNSGLDPVTARIIDRLIHDITIEFGITTIINTHDMSSVRLIGDHIIFLSDGKACWEGTKQQLSTGMVNNKLLGEFVTASATDVISAE